MNDKYFMALSFMVYFYKTNAIFEICIPESTKKNTLPNLLRQAAQATIQNTNTTKRDIL